jgi:hypothetical protein
MSVCKTCGALGGLHKATCTRPWLADVGTPSKKASGMLPVESVNHPSHYGGEDDPYEVIKVAEAWGFDKDAYLFNVLKYIGRADKKGATLDDHKKARFYLDRKIKQLEAGR